VTKPPEVPATAPVVTPLDRSAAARDAIAAAIRATPAPVPATVTVDVKGVPVKLAPWPIPDKVSPEWSSTRRALEGATVK
jgi:hypothetical protein